ncbi:MAG: Uma2 family endonuclease [Acidobacteria bacterium]|nr:Uma2 family endonuclease [Acidobacteriota bacterium]
MALLKDYKDLWMTGEELFRRPDLNPCELVNGRVVPTMPTGGKHGEIELELGARLRSYGKELKRGRALGGEVGIYIRRDPDTVRAADLLYISEERFARLRSPGYLEIAPELVVEILSPDDRWSEVMEKVSDYFEAGVVRVWVLDPKPRRVFVYRSPAEFVQLEAAQILTDEEILPGFSVLVAELFPK